MKLFIGYLQVSLLRLPESMVCFMLNVFLYMSIPYVAKSQCSGGNFASTINPSISWQTVSCNTYSYYTFSAIAGQSLVFSFCQGGGSNSVDTQLEVHNNSGASIGFYNDDNCGTGSEVSFTAPSSGTYRISIYRYDCQTTSVSAGTLAYKVLIPNNQDCVGAITVCQPTYYQDQSYFGHGAILDYTSNNNCPGLCVDSEDLSVWYTFQVQTSGVLDFRITANLYESDYDWVLINLTNHDCSIIPSINSYPQLITSCNAAFDYGPTGANTLTPNTGDNCQGPSTLGEYPINNPAINVTAGQIYYLNIQNWSATQGGYTLDFSHSTATIFDNFPPAIDMTVPPGCSDNSFTVLFNENIDCSSIGSGDFTIVGPGGPYTITNLYGPACNIGGSMEREFIITFSPALTSSGSYTISYNGNAEDMCGNMCSPDSWTFNVIPELSMTLSSAPSSLNQIFCAGASISPITWNSSGGTNVNFTGLPPGVSGNFSVATGVITISGTPGVTGTFSFTLTLTGSCGQQSANGTITIGTSATPVFTAYGPYCVGTVPAALPVLSQNGIQGTWSPSSVNTASSGTFDYTFTPTAGQCASPVTISVTIIGGPQAVFDQFGPYCPGAPADMLPAISNNGIAGNWSPAVINTAVSGTTAYTFTPSSGVCPVSVIQNIVVAEPIQVQAVVSRPVNCIGINGQILVSASGGIPPYTGIGSFPVNTGTYNYEVTDLIGCEGSDSVSMVQPDGLIAAMAKVNDVDCQGNATGRIGIDVLSGSPPYFIRWEESSISSQTSYLVLENLRVGRYDITVTDLAGCSYAQSVTITEPEKIELEVLTIDPSCIGNNDGMILIQAIGGTEPYVYRWEEMAIDTLLLTGLDEGQYRITVHDANNCFANPGIIELSDNPVDCLRIPDAFTPNGDGINDTWEIFNIHLYPNARVRIYNRWGQVMYSDSPISNPWDGTYNGRALPVGVYLYVLQTFAGTRDYTGTVTLVR